MSSETDRTKVGPRTDAGRTIAAPPLPYTTFINPVATSDGKIGDKK